MFIDFGIINFWTYLLGAIFIVLAPGPETMFIIKTSVKNGISCGFIAIFSILLSDIILVLLAWCGVAAIINSTPILFYAIQYVGAAYLFYLGLQTLYSLFKRDHKKIEIDKNDSKGLIGKGMLVTLLNPKTLLFYISFFSQFININASHSWLAFILLALVMFVITFIYFGFLVFFGSFLINKLKGNKFLPTLGNTFVGLFFIGFAIKLANSHR